MLQSQRSLFQLPPEVSYLNCAYMSPLFQKVVDAGIEGIHSKQRPYLVSPQDFFTKVKTLKKAFARIINAQDYQRIAVVPAASYAIANVVNNIKLKPGQKILMAEDQFPSNYYSWEKLAQSSGATIECIRGEEGPGRGENWNQKILESIDQDTAVVTISHVHWADGTRFDLGAIRKRTREVGALLIVDASQSLGALPLDVQEIELDALVAVGYKWLFGPYGMSLAYYGPYFDQGTPIEENWINRKGSEDFRNLVNYESEYQPLAGRYSMGQQSNFVNVPMQIEALHQIASWGVTNIQQYAAEVSAPFIPQLQEMGCLLEEAKWRGSHLMGIRITAQYFDSERLKEAMNRRKVFTSMRGNAIRVSTHVFNETADWEKLVDCFKESRKES